MMQGSPVVIKTKREVEVMTGMKRMSIAIPDELDDRILALRKTDEFIRCSYSEIVRQIIERGLDLERAGTYSDGCPDKQVSTAKPSA